MTPRRIALASGRARCDVDYSSFWRILFAIWVARPCDTCKVWTDLISTGRTI